MITTNMEIEKLSKQGNDALHKGDFEQAHSCLTKVLQIDPKNADAYVSRGIANLGKGNLDEAINDWNEAVRLNPNNAVAYPRDLRLVAENKLLSPSRKAVVSSRVQWPKIPSRCRSTILAACSIGSNSPLVIASASARTQAHQFLNRLRASAALPEA